MRRPAVALVLLLAATGCAGGSQQAAERPGAGAAPPAGPAGADSAQVTDGRLGQAVVARPGKTTVIGRVRRLPAAGALPAPPGAGVGAEERCGDTELRPSAETLQRVSDAVFCLMNAMRENAGLPALKHNELLARASVAHSDDMVENRYFAHDSQDGRDLVARLKAVAYIPVDAEWVVGENLVWGSGGLSTPRALVDAWMNSKGHRDNLLSGDFVEVGMGPALGTPSADAPDGVTFTTDFGTRFTSVPAAAPAEPAAGQSAAPPKPAATTRSARRRAAIRRCAKRSGRAKRRCLRAARRTR